MTEVYKGKMLNRTVYKHYEYITSELFECMSFITFSGLVNEDQNYVFIIIMYTRLASSIAFVAYKKEPCFLLK